MVSEGQLSADYRQLLADLPVAVYSTDAAGIITFYNRAAAELWGREPEIGKDLWCGSWRIYDVYGDPLPLDACPMAVALREGRAVQGAEIIVERPDGLRMRVHPSPVPMRNPDGALVGAVNTLVNANGRTASDEASRRLAAIVQYSDDAIVSKNLHSIIMSWNRGAERLFGYTEAEAIGQSVLMLIPPELVQEERTILERIRKGESIDHYETTRRRKDGVLVPISLTVSPIKDAGGRVIGASKIARDITERKRFQDELERARDEAQAASQAKDNFFAALSHELRTPLNPVLLVASEAKDNPDLPPDIRADFEMIYNNVNLEARLIDDMLDLARISRGILELNKAVVVLDSIIRDSSSMVQGEIAEKGVRLNLQLGGGHCGLVGDAVRLQQAYWNILRNAVKFTPRGGTVTVTTRADPARQVYTISISDTGIGLSADDVSRIFEPFTQGEHRLNGQRANFGGLGLGLAISEYLVKLHEGSISATSAGSGHGSTFTISLPYTLDSLNRDLDRPVKQDAPSAPADRRSLTILLVDDHEPTCLVLARFLKRLGHRALVAQTVEEAESIAAQHTLDLLVSDIGLPDGNGYELMERLKQNQPGLRGIAVSGYGMADDVARSSAAGFIEHCTKPIRIEVLEDVINRIAHEPVA